MKITIDQKQCDAGQGQTVLDAARANGIYIPTLCNHERTQRSGQCRVCVVEVEGMRGFQTSCTLKAADGMQVRTNTEEIMETRRMITALLLSNGRHDCLACEASGECELQDLAYRLGIEEPPFLLGTERSEPDTSSEGIIRDHDRCILCGRCVDACGSNVMRDVLEVGGRGDSARIICDNDRPMGDSSCVQCGECVQVCPVGALLFKPAKGAARRWEVEKKKVICSYCGVGCVIDMAVKNNRCLWADGREENWRNLPNKGMLCVKGRFGHEYINHPDRLKTPLIRRNDKLESAGWDEALEFAAEGLKRNIDAHGPDAVGCFSSAKTSNEENFAMMRFARAVVGTNNVDHCARLCHSSTVAALADVFGSGAMTNSMQEAHKSDVILVTGSNTTRCHPVFGNMIEQAVRREGVKLIVVDPRETDLARIADIHLRQRGGSDVAWLMGMQRIIEREGWHDREYIQERCEGWGKYRASLDHFTPDVVEELSGIPEDELHNAARLFATSGVGAIYYSMGITQHTHGVDNVKAVANLAMLTGNVGLEGGGVNPLRGQSNVQGACDLGALPNVYSGYQKVSDASVRQKFSERWGAELPETPGKAVTTMVNDCGDSIKALYIMGENPMITDPNLNHVEKQLAKLDFLIVQDIFMTETAEMADVVLPAAASLEKTGTYTNTERRVQLSRKALEPPGAARQDGEIIADMAGKFGHKNFPRTPKDLFAEIRNLTPSYAGMSYRRLEREGLRWPCPDNDHPGTPILHVGHFVRAKGKLSPLRYKPPNEEPDTEYPLCLSTGRMLEHFHAGSMSRRSRVLSGIVRENEIEVNRKDARRAGVKDGEMIRVKSRRGEITARASVGGVASVGMVYIPFHFVEAAANRLTNDALDPVALIPEYKVCAVRIEPAENT